MTIQEAWKKVLEIRGDRTTCVKIELWQYTMDSRGVMLKMWDGQEHYDAKSLEDLIRLAEASVAEKTEVIDGELPEMGGKDEPAS